MRQQRAVAAVGGWGGAVCWADVDVRHSYGPLYWISQHYSVRLHRLAMPEHVVAETAHVVASGLLQASLAGGSSCSDSSERLFTGVWASSLGCVSQRRL
jgi:hypothetical protein